MMMADVHAEHKLGVLPDEKYHGFKSDLNGYLDGFCVAGGLNAEQVVEELHGYAEALVNNNWDAILRVGTYLLATGSIKNSRMLRKAAGIEFQKPSFKFSPALTALGVLLPTTQPKATSLLPQERTAMTTTGISETNKPILEEKYQMPWSRTPENRAFLGARQRSAARNIRFLYDGIDDFLADIGFRQRKTLPWSKLTWQSPLSREMYSGHH